MWGIIISRGCWGIIESMDRERDVRCRSLGLDGMADEKREDGMRL